jgi:hypothetical protein
MRKINGTTKAWLGKYTSLSVANNPSDDMIINEISFSKADMSMNGWTLIGEATVSLNMISNEEIINSKIATLKAEKQKIQADAFVQANELEEEISKLLYISDKSNLTDEDIF